MPTRESGEFCHMLGGHQFSAPPLRAALSVTSNRNGPKTQGAVWNIRNAVGKNGFCSSQIDQSE